MSSSRARALTSSPAFIRPTASCLNPTGYRRLVLLFFAITLSVYDAAGVLAAEYTSAAAQASPCGTCYLTADTLGSTRMITDETATPRECHDFLPFGEEITRTAG